MPDLTDPETPTEDALEQEQTLGEAALDESRDREAPEADALEQHTAVGRPEQVVERGLPIEADEADTAEQSLVVDSGDDDDYR